MVNCGVWRKESKSSNISTYYYQSESLWASEQSRLVVKGIKHVLWVLI